MEIILVDDNYIVRSDGDGNSTSCKDDVDNGIGYGDSIDYYGNGYGNGNDYDNDHGDGYVYSYVV